MRLTKWKSKEMKSNSVTVFEIYRYCLNRTQKYTLCQVYDDFGRNVANKCGSIKLAFLMGNNLCVITLAAVINGKN